MRETVAVFLNGALILLALMLPRLELARWRKRRFAPCTFGRVFRILLFSGCFLAGAGGRQLLVVNHICGSWCGGIVTWWLIGVVVAGLGSAYYIASYMYDLWVLRPEDVERKQLKDSAAKDCLF